jgi:peptide methionine sulfoxide reductase MsrB
MPVMEVEKDRTFKSRIYRCIYCGNEVFSIEDDRFDPNDCMSFLSPKRVTNVNIVEDKIFPYDKVELFCGRCGVSLGHKLIDRSGLIGDKTVIRLNMLEASYGKEGDI